VFIQFLALVLLFFIYIFYIFILMVEAKERLICKENELEQKKTHQQHFDSRLQVVFDTARAGMYTLTPVRDEMGEIIDFRFGLVNQAVASYLGLMAADLVGTLGSVHFPAYKSNGLFDRYVDTVRTGNPATFDLHYADGYDNYFTINVVKMGDELFGTFTDHSPLKRLQRDLEASISELKRSNASLEQFAHAASHDLQDPLRKITLHATKLEEHHSAALNDEAFGHLERIKTASKRMQRLVKDLLVFAEVGANRPDFEDVALNALLQEVVNDLEVAITEKEAVISIGDLGTVKGDSLHLQQLFQNLISNSLKYSRSEVAPHITITASIIQGKDTGVVLGDYEKAKDFWQIKLRDNGQGFNQEQAQQIFKIFQRLPQHRNECSGTGIGLAIVQRVVENHNGYIKAEGIPGRGAIFTILLPVI
jgi:signal transduction histidine kinase